MIEQRIGRVGVGVGVGVGGRVGCWGDGREERRGQERESKVGGRARMRE